MSSLLLETRSLSAGYDGVPIVRDLNITVGAGEVVVLLGRNGAGKTTTLHTIAGLLDPVAGSVDLFGARARGALHRRARSGLGLVTEDRTLVRRLSVGENLRLGHSDVEVAFAMFPELRSLRNRKAGLLSGGEQQMLVLARVLSARPKLLLADELSFGLAPLIVRRLLDAVRSSASIHMTGVLLVEQQAVAALAVADRGYVLRDGQVTLSGSARDLLANLGAIEESYLAAAGAAGDKRLGQIAEGEKEP